MSFEKVHAVWDFYDGPRSGIADFGGAPHHFVNDFDEDTEEYAETFTLRPIDGATMLLVKKQREIWRTWELAFHRGELDKSTHPALPGQNDAYAQLGIEIKTEMDTNTAAPVAATASFRARADQPALPKGVLPDLEVIWTPASTTR